MSRPVLLYVLAIWAQGCWGKILVTQTPEHVTVSVGSAVTVSCKTSAKAFDGIARYQQAPGRAPKLLIRRATNRAPGVPERFSGSMSFSSLQDYTLTISQVEAGDAAIYHCQQHLKTPYTFGGGTTVDIKRDDAAPSVFIFPPSPEQLSEGTASVLCLMNTFYPGDAQVTWKADDKVITKDVENSANMPDTNNTYSRSSMVTFTKAEWESYNVFTCEVTQKALASPLQKSINREGCA